MAKNFQEYFGNNKFLLGMFVGLAIGIAINAGMYFFWNWEPYIELIQVIVSAIIAAAAIIGIFFSGTVELNKKRHLTKIEVRSFLKYNIKHMVSAVREHNDAVNSAHEFVTNRDSEELTVTDLWRAMFEAPDFKSLISRCEKLIDHANSINCETESSMLTDFKKYVDALNEDKNRVETAAHEMGCKKDFMLHHHEVEKLLTTKNEQYLKAILTLSKITWGVAPRALKSLLKDI